jgi:hypothetical protein
MVHVHGHTSILLSRIIYLQYQFENKIKIIPQIDSPGVSQSEVKGLGAILLN